MQYARAKWKQYQDSLAYCVYVTDSLQLIPQNMHLQKRWIEIVNPEITDSRTGNEIALDVIKRACLNTE